MKKIFIILLCMITLNANATEMCARNDTVVIPLDATISTVDTNRFFNGIESIWGVVFSYGAVYGSGTCLSKKEIMMYSDWNGTNKLVGYEWSLDATASDELIGSQDYYMNANVNPDIPAAEKSDYERRYCFGKITHPMSTPWVFQVESNVTQCKNDCVSSVSWNFVRNSNQRDRMFNTIGTVPPWTE